MVQAVDAVADRVLCKTPEGVFQSRLREEFELSPAVGRAIRELARECLFGEIPQTPGKLLFWCASGVRVTGFPWRSRRRRALCWPWWTAVTT